MPAYMFTLSENLVKIGRGHVHSEIIGFQGSSEKKWSNRIAIGRAYAGGGLNYRKGKLGNKKETAVYQ